MTATYAVAGPEEMRDLGARLASCLRSGDLVVLSGPLGSGKTVLVQGLARGLGVSEPVTSPTFVLARVHAGTALTLVHVDAYRLGTAWELDDLDLDSDLVDGAVVAVEWGGGLAERLSANRLEVTLDRGEGDRRTVRLLGVGPRWARPGGQPMKSVVLPS